MISDAAHRLVAVVESVAPWLDDEQASRAIRYLMALAGEGSEQAIAEKRRQLAGRGDRELDAHGGDE
jgi:hypothetical protein